MIEKLDRVEYLLKHMPGRHDQQKHAPIKFMGTAVTKKWLDSQTEMFEELEGADRAAGWNLYTEMTKEAILSGNVTQEDLSGVKFTIEPPYGYHYNDAMDLVATADGHVVTGVYKIHFGIGKRNTIHISADLYDYGRNKEERLQRVVVHEVGHNVVSKMGGKAYERKQTADFMIDAFRELNDQELADLGMRRYSLTNSGEFLADTYKIMRLGDEGQQETLAMLWGEADWNISDLEDVFKQFDMMNVEEIQGVQVDTDTVEFIQIPVSIPIDILHKTPWYYVES